MSKFSTRIPVDLKGLLALLPEGAYIDRMTFSHVIDDRNRNQMVEDINSGKIVPEVILFWEDDKLQSQTTLPVNFSVSELKGKTLPKNVRDVVNDPLPKVEPKVEEPESIPATEPVKMDVLTEKELRECVKKGEPVEFQGYEPFWKDFDPKEHSFNKVFFYRKKVDIAP